jgi:UTP--glucose-1-phosphate uridylyltransferase
LSELSLKTIIFPAAGLGTRFLPATKACRKELLPVVDKPLIQYAAEEAADAGFEQIIFIIRTEEKSISRHFSDAPDLRERLAKTKTQQEVDALTRTIAPSVICRYVEQPEALGLGHAVWLARPFIEEQHFAVLLPDDLIDGGSNGGCMSQMMEYYKNNKCGAIGVEEVAASETKKYGIVSTEDSSAKVSKIITIVEKPSPEKAPSRLGVVGRYILPTSIMSVIEDTKLGVGGEIQITDAIAAILGKERIDAYRFDGIRYDCGSKLGYLQANVAYAMQSEELGVEFSNWLSNEVL